MGQTSGRPLWRARLKTLDGAGQSLSPPAARSGGGGGEDQAAPPNDLFSLEGRRVSPGLVPPRPMGRGPAPRQRQPRPPAFKAQSASCELTPQPEPVAGRRGRGCLGTEDPSGPDGRKGLRPWPAPPGSRRRCPVSVCRAGGLRAGTGDATGAGYAHAPITRADPRPRAHALRAGTRPQPSTITLADPARHLLDSPGAPTAPWPGCARGRVYIAYRLARRRGCEQTK